jgi:hypothetical protein
MNKEALENLVRIHKLHHEAVDANEVQGLIQSGNVRLKDAGLEALSQESRFDLSYNAAHALSLAHSVTLVIGRTIDTWCFNACSTRSTCRQPNGGFLIKPIASETSQNMKAIST